MTSVVQYLKQNRKRHLDELMELLSIPSVSTDPARSRRRPQGGDWMHKRRSRARAAPRVEIHETDGHPIVYGEWLGAPGKPTILVYGHYDVQPEDPVELWDSAPFTPTERSGKLYARGASDDKGQVIIHVNALEAHLRPTAAARSTSSSSSRARKRSARPTSRTVHRANKKAGLRRGGRLGHGDVRQGRAVDLLRAARPGLPGGRRAGTNRDLHSGSFGGAVVNPANALVADAGHAEGRQGQDHDPGLLRQRPQA